MIAIHRPANLSAKVTGADQITVPPSPTLSDVMNALATIQKNQAQLAASIRQVQLNQKMIGYAIFAAVSGLTNNEPLPQTPTQTQQLTALAFANGYYSGQILVS